MIMLDAQQYLIRPDTRDSNAIDIVMTTLIHKFVEQCRAGTLARAVCKVSSGWVVLGESQFLRGYSLILPDPVVSDLNALSIEDRRGLLHEAAILGDALLEITGAVRMNYEILGNLEPALHVHVFPRYAKEPGELKTKPVWFYDWDDAPQFDRDRDAAMMSEIRDYMQDHCGT